MFEVVLDDDAEEWSVMSLLKGDVLDGKLERIGILWEEDGVLGLGWVRHEVVGVEVLDEAAEFRLC